MQAENERPRDPGPEPEKTAEGPRVAGATRCPFCRAAVDLETQEWVACQGCLARHHASCWREHGSCSSCGTAKRLAPTAPRSGRGPVGLAVAALVLVVASAAYQTRKLVRLENRLDAREQREAAAPLADLAAASIAETDAVARVHGASEVYERAREARHFDRTRGDFVQDITPTEVNAALASYLGARAESGRRLLELSAGFERAGKADEATRIRTLAIAIADGSAANVFADQARAYETWGIRALEGLATLDPTKVEEARKSAAQNFDNAAFALLKGQPAARVSDRLLEAGRAIRRGDSPQAVLAGLRK